MKTILFFESDLSKGIYEVNLVEASAIPESFCSWGFYTDAQGHGYYQLFIDYSGDSPKYLAVDYCHERKRGDRFLVEVGLKTRRSALPYISTFFAKAA